MEDWVCYLPPHAPSVTLLAIISFTSTNIEGSAVEYLTTRRHLTPLLLQIIDCSTIVSRTAFISDLGPSKKNFLGMTLANQDTECPSKKRTQ